MDLTYLLAAAAVIVALQLVSFFEFRNRLVHREAKLKAAFARREAELLDKNNLSLTSLRADRDSWRHKAELIESAGELLAENRIEQLEKALTAETEARKRAEAGPIWKRLPPGSDAEKLRLIGVTTSALREKAVEAIGEYSEERRSPVSDYLERLEAENEKLRRSTSIALGYVAGRVDINRNRPEIEHSLREGLSHE